MRIHIKGVPDAKPHKHKVFLRVVLSLTNEQLAEFIQQGGGDDLIPVLWERVRKLLYLLSDEWRRSHAVMCADRGIEAWDIKQAAYFAFLKAVDSFKAKDGLPLASYFKYSLTNEIRKLLGGKNAALNNADRLDAPLKNGDEGDEAGALDRLIDDAAQESFERIEDESIADTVRAAVVNLPDRLRAIIDLYYFRGLNYLKCGAVLGVSRERARQLKNVALDRLRNDSGIKQLADAYGYSSSRIYSNSLTAYKQSGVTNVEVIAINRADKEAEIKDWWEKVKKQYLNTTT